ncbi:hypothetical protein [Catellatospora vulcania]|uniref:hypothetical protein n=1 Tax=Catellatospora vulcania TaxID=1460450 RepID=UPI0012D47A5B|nr:hypothetical protein [Catellatospora vulcania]
MSDNPYRAPAPAGPPVEPAPAKPAVGAWSDPSLDAPPPLRRQIEARLVWRGMFWMLGAHLLVTVLPLAAALAFGQRTDEGPLAEGDAASVFLMAGLCGQFLLGIVALVAGIGGVLAKDGGKGAGILIGWVVGIPASLIAGIVITASLADM